MAAFPPRGKQIVSIQTIYEAKLNLFITKNSETVQSIYFVIVYIFNYLVHLILGWCVGLMCLHTTVSL